MNETEVQPPKMSDGDDGFSFEDKGVRMMHGRELRWKGVIKP